MLEIRKPNIEQSKEVIAAAMNRAKKKRHANQYKWQKLLKQPEAVR